MGWWAPVCCGMVSTLCAVVPPPGPYGVVGTGVLWDVSTWCAVVPPGLYGVVGTGVLWDGQYTVRCSTSSWTICGVVEGGSHAFATVRWSAHLGRRHHYEREGPRVARLHRRPLPHAHLPPPHVSPRPAAHSTACSNCAAWHATGMASRGRIGGGLKARFERFSTSLCVSPPG
jgi:hypothetical protein